MLQIWPSVGASICWGHSVLQTLGLVKKHIWICFRCFPKTGWTVVMDYSFQENEYEVGDEVEAFWQDLNPAMEGYYPASISKIEGNGK